MSLLIEACLNLISKIPLKYIHTLHALSSWKLLRGYLRDQIQTGYILHLFVVVYVTAASETSGQNSSSCR
jgi:hypothetical protein